MKTLTLIVILMTMGAISSDAREYTMSLKIRDDIKFTSFSPEDVEYPDNGKLTVFSIERDPNGNLMVNIPFVYNTSLGKYASRVEHKLSEGSSMTMGVIFINKSRSVRRNKVPMLVRITIKELTEKTLTITYVFEKP